MTRTYLRITGSAKLVSTSPGSPARGSLGLTLSPHEHMGRIVDSATEIAQGSPRASEPLHVNATRRIAAALAGKLPYLIELLDRSGTSLQVQLKQLLSVRPGVTHLDGLGGLDDQHPPLLLEFEHLPA